VPQIAARALTQDDPATMAHSPLRRTIRAGLAGTFMPAWGSVMPPNDIDAVAAYVERAFFRAGRDRSPSSRHVASELHTAL
jgi:mono/diheme cytochrome c family protein